MSFYSKVCRIIKFIYMYMYMYVYIYIQYMIYILKHQ